MRRLFLLPLLLAASGATYGEVTTLPFRPIAVEYSASLNSLVAITASPNQLHIFDPLSKTDTVIALNKAPTSLSVSPNGYYAAVGHDALISYVNLATRNIEKLIPVSFYVTDVVLSGRDFVYASAGGWYYSSGGGSYRISTGSRVGTMSFGGTFPRLHPSENAIYTTRDAVSPNDIEKYDVSTGAITAHSDSPYHGDHPACRGIWYSPDGALIYNGCGAVYTASDVAAKDMLYAGTFSRSGLIEALSSSAHAGRIALMPAQSTYYYGQPQRKDNEIQLYSLAERAYQGSLTLPDVQARGSSHQVHGKWLFFSGDGKALYAVVQADGAAGLLNDFALHSYHVSSAGGCSAAVSASGTPIAPGGGSVSVSVTAGSDCLWVATSTSAWLDPPSDRVGTGNETLIFRAGPNTSASRTATVSVDGNSATISQAAGSPQPAPFKTLSFNVIDAEYSRSLNRVAMISADPDRLHIFDPATGADAFVVVLPLAARTVGISPDGFYAAVGHDALMTYIDLRTGAIVGTYNTSAVALDVVLGGNGYAYIFPARDQWSRIHSINLSNGAESTTYGIYAGTVARLHPDGKAIYGANNGLSPSDIEKYAITGGVAAMLYDSPYHGEFQMCGNLWFTEMGDRIVTACANTFRASEARQQDMTYAGNLFSPNIINLRWVAHSQALKTFFVIPRTEYNNPNAVDVEIRRVEHEFLNPAGSIPLTKFGTYPAHGRWVFVSADSTKLYVLSEADSTADLDRLWALETITLDSSVPPTCTFVLGQPVTNVPATAGTYSVAVTAAAGCTWNASKSQPWVTFQGASSGSGNGAVTYQIAANTSAAERTANITIASQSFTVRQAGVAAPVSSGAQPQTIEPPSGVVGTQVFMATFTNADGADKIASAYVLFQSTVRGDGACLVEYTRSTGGFRLLDNAGTGWSVTVFPLDTTSVLKNSQCSVPAEGLVAYTSGTRLSLFIPVTFEAAFAGPRNAYLLANDLNGRSSGWRAKGSYTVDASQIAGPGVLGIEPLSGASTTAAFTATFSHGGGAGQHYLAYMLFLPTPNVVQYTATGSCLVEYNRISHGMRLVNDAGTNWLGPLEGIRLGAPGASLANDVCSIDITQAAASVKRNLLVVSVPVTFKNPIGRVVGTFLQAFDVKGKFTGMTQIGGWTPNGSDMRTGPRVNGASQQGTSGTALTMTAHVSNSTGLNHLTAVHFRVASRITAADPCHVVYFPATGTLALINDAGDALVSGVSVPLGVAGTLSNSRCTVDTGAATKQNGDGTLIVSVPVTFVPEKAAGERFIYINAFDDSGKLSHWVLGGVFRVE